MNEDITSTIQAEDSSPLPSSYLFVSLYLVILAFFILLNSISKIDKEKSLEKINAVRNAFFTPIINANSFNSQPTKNINHDITLKHYLAPIGTLLQDTITLVPLLVEEDGDILEITIKNEDFFEENSSNIRFEQEDFIYKLAQNVSNIETGTIIDLEFIISSTEFHEYPTATNSLAIARSGAFAQKLIDMGVNSTSLLVGIEIDNTIIDSFKLRFTPKNARNSAITPDISIINSNNIPAGEQINEPE